MIVDSSALAAIVFGEDDADRYRHALRTTQPAEMSVANWLEVSMVLQARAGREAIDDLQEIIREYKIKLMPMTAHQARAALDAFYRYGKGTGAKAPLNFGDCIAYGLASTRNAPLLFKGKDFAETNIVPALR